MPVFPLEIFDRIIFYACGCDRPRCTPYSPPDKAAALPLLFVSHAVHDLAQRYFWRTVVLTRSSDWELLLGKRGLLVEQRQSTVCGRARARARVAYVRELFIDVEAGELLKWNPDLLDFNAPFEAAVSVELTTGQLSSLDRICLLFRDAPSLDPTKTTGDIHADLDEMISHMLAAKEDGYNCTWSDGWDEDDLDEEESRRREELMEEEYEETRDFILESAAIYAESWVATALGPLLRQPGLRSLAVNWNADPLFRTYEKDSAILPPIYIYLEEDHAQPRADGQQSSLKSVALVLARHSSEALESPSLERRVSQSWPSGIGCSHRARAGRRRTR